MSFILHFYLEYLSAFMGGHTVYQQICISLYYMYVCIVYMLGTRYSHLSHMDGRNILGSELTITWQES